MKLIDVLVMISKGKLKEGTKVKVSIMDDEYTYMFFDLTDKNGKQLFDNYTLYALHQEVELIEPDKDIDVPTTEKIEELKQLDMDFAEIDFASHEEYARCSIQVLARKMMKQIDKLNEVIRYINKEG